MKRKNYFAIFLTGLGTLLASCNIQLTPNSSATSEETSVETPSNAEIPSSEETSVETPSSEETPVISSPEVQYTYEYYCNPVSVSTGSSDYVSEVADPSIVKGDDGYLYVFATGQVVLKSEDGCNFEFVTSNLFSMPTWWKDVYPNKSSNNFGIWAPDVIKIKDKWIYYYSLSGWDLPCGIGYAVADDIAGPYVDKGKLFDINEIGIMNCIDPHVYVEDDGSVYMSVGSFRGLFLVELTEDGMACLNGKEYQNENKVLIAGKVGNWDGSTYEGSYIIKNNGYYYYFGSSGTCCEGANSSYQVRVGRSESIYGPYIDSDGFDLTQSSNGVTKGNLVLWAGSATNRSVYGPGHNSIYLDDKGDYWIYYHAYCDTDNYRTRHLFMDKLSWDDDGYPYVSYTDPDTDKEVKKKPSYGIELPGPCFAY